MVRAIARRLRPAHPAVPCSRGQRCPRIVSRRARRARVPRRPGLALGRRRRVRVRRDDERPRRPARATRRARSVLDPRGRARGGVARRNGEDALPYLRRQAGRGRPDALQGRAPLDLSVVPVRLPAHVYVLRDRPDALRPEPDRLGDPRPGAPLPAHRARRPLRLHGHGRADAEPRRRPRGCRAPSRPRHHPPAHDDLHGRLASGPDELRGRGRRADPPRPLPPCRRAGSPLAADAGERPLPAGGRPRRVPPVRREAPPQSVRRVRDARRRQRSSRASCGTGPRPRLEGVQGQPDPVQPDGCLRRIGPSDDRRVQVGPRSGGNPGDRAPHPRPRHRRGLRPAGGKAAA